MTESRRNTTLRLAVLISLIGLVVAGCGRPSTLESDYGRRRTGARQRSVNGLDAFGKMFEESGHSVSTWRRLSPKLNGRRKNTSPRNEERAYNVIVWAPDDFGPPGNRQIAFLNDWVANGGTLIYIGRDYDAEIDYWQSVMGSVPAPEIGEATRRLAAAQARHDTFRLDMPAGEVTPWFVMKRDMGRRRINQLQGPWSDGVKAEAAEITLHGQLVSPTEKQTDAFEAKLAQARTELKLDTYVFEDVLSAGDSPLITRVVSTSWEGQVFVVANGSFLLNLPLVNAENRKIATRLVNESGAPGRVAILESDAGGPTVFEIEPGYQNRPKRREPLATIMDHATVLGVLICFIVLPIFGRPRVEPSESISEFGRHVDAVAELMVLTRNTKYARDMIAQYHQVSGGETIKKDDPKPEPPTKAEVAQQVDQP